MRGPRSPDAIIRRWPDSASGVSQGSPYLRPQGKLGRAGFQISQTARAEAFHQLHQAPDVLVLPNAWDVASAVIVAEAGAKAIATSSAAVAWALGYADGDLLPVDQTCALAAAISRATDLPLSVDFEGGFTDDLDALSRNITQVIEAGVVGINFEDGARDPQLHAPRPLRRSWTPALPTPCSPSPRARRRCRSGSWDRRRAPAALSWRHDRDA